MTQADRTERLLTPGEVARMFRVEAKTVTRWAAAGRLECIRTPGGHRRFPESAVRRVLGDDVAETPARDEGPGLRVVGGRVVRPRQDWG